MNANVDTTKKRVKKRSVRLRKTQNSTFMDHSASQSRINRAKGQLEGVSRMIEERRYCPEIIIQIRAVTNALKAAEQEILHRHLRGCVKTALQTKNPFDIEDKINEIMNLMVSK